MTITAFPFDGQDTTEDQFSRLFRELQDSGVAESYGFSGFLVAANSSGMNVTVQPGVAVVRGHAVESTAVETVSIPAASTSARTDRIVLRLDPAVNGIALSVVQGTPGAGTPALTQTDLGVFELPLAVVAVAANAVTIAASDVTDDRRYTGTRVGAWSNATRPNSPRIGQAGFNGSTGILEFWDGVQWLPVGGTEDAPPDPGSVAASGEFAVATTSWTALSALATFNLTLARDAIVQVEYSAELDARCGSNGVPGGVFFGVSHNGGPPEGLFGGIRSQVLQLDATLPNEDAFMAAGASATHRLATGSHAFVGQVKKWGNAASYVRNPMMRVTVIRWAS